MVIFNNKIVWVAQYAPFYKHDQRPRCTKIIVGTWRLKFVILSLARKVHFGQRCLPKKYLLKNCIFWPLRAKAQDWFLLWFFNVVPFLATFLYLSNIKFILNMEIIWYTSAKSPQIRKIVPKTW